MMRMPMGIVSTPNVFLFREMEIFTQFVLERLSILGHVMRDCHNIGAIIHTFVEHFLQMAVRSADEHEKCNKSSQHGLINNCLCL